MASLEESQQNIHYDDTMHEAEIGCTYNCVLYDSHNIDQGVNVLRLLLPLKCFDDVFSHRPYNMGSRTPLPILKECSKSLVDMFNEVNRAADKDAMLKDLSRKLFENTSRHLPLPGNVSMQQYARNFTGRFTRWETVGVIVTSLAIFKAANELSKRNALEELSKPPSWKALIEASNACIGFCDDLSSVNDVLLWMLGENTLVQTLFNGDASKSHFGLLWSSSELAPSLNRELDDKDL